MVLFYFNRVLRFSNRKGNIFVGFSTGQDTGLLIDISAQLYPTMEREHIDWFGHIGEWNKDLVSMCGVILRSFYNHLMALGNQPTPQKRHIHFILG